MFIHAFPCTKTELNAMVLAPLQVSGDVLQGIPGYPTACQPLYQPVLNDAGLRHARVAIIR